MFQFALYAGIVALVATGSGQDSGELPEWSWRESPRLVDLAGETRRQRWRDGDQAVELPAYGGALPRGTGGTRPVLSVISDDEVAVLYVDAIEGSPWRGDLMAWLGSREALDGEGIEGGVVVRLLESEGRSISPLEVVMDGGDGGLVARAQVRTPGAGMIPRVLEVDFSRSEVEARRPRRGFTIPIIDLASETERQVVVDREDGQYLGHPTTVLLEDGRTILCVYPKGHGRGGIVYKRSEDGGRTWSDRLPTPESWATSREVPTIHQVIDPEDGATRLIMWSGLHPARLASSEDNGRTWTELEPVGEWGGIVVMGFVERLADGRYLAMFHDDGRFLHETPGPRGIFTLLKTISEDGGRSWSAPEPVFVDGGVHLCEPGFIRSPDGDRVAILLRENSRTRNSWIMFSDDEGETWSPPRELPASLTGDRHTGIHAPDGRLFISFRDLAHESPTRGDWVAWVGTWEDLERGTEGQYRVRLMDNHVRADCAYPGVLLLPDGTIVTTTYGHWTPGAQPWIASVRLRLEELDARHANPESIGTNPSHP